MEVVHQLLVGHLAVVIAALGALFALGLDHRLADVVGAAAIFLGIDAPGFGRFIEARRHVAADVVLAGGSLVADHPHRVVAALVHLEQRRRQAIVDEGRQFRVDRRQVVALVEVVADDLPVEVRVRRHVEHAHPVVELVALEPFGEGREPFLQRGDVIVHAPEHERAPGLAAQLRKPGLAAGVAAGEIVGVLHVDERAVGIELPAVIGAGDARGGAGIADDQAVTAVGAAVVERLYRAIGLLDHDDRFLAEVVADEIALFLQLGGHAAQVPHLGPEMVLLQLHPFLGDVAVGGDGVAAHGHVEIGRITRDRLLNGHDFGSSPNGLPLGSWGAVPANPDARKPYACLFPQAPDSLPLAKLAG